MPSRSVRAASAALASVMALAAAPAVPVEEPLTGVVEVFTAHREVPDGVLQGAVSIGGDTSAPGQCPVGEVVRVVCTDEGATGAVTAATLGFSATHRHGLAAPDGTVRDVLQVEPSVGGELVVTVEFPSAFDSKILDAPNASAATDRSAVWRMMTLPGEVHSFEMLIAGPGAGVSELADVTIELHREEAPLVVSSFGEVRTPTGTLTTRLHTAADRDAIGTQPAFSPVQRDVAMAIDGHAVGIVPSAQVESNGAYSGPAFGHVEGKFSDVRANRDLSRPFGVNDGVGYETFSDFGRLKVRTDGFDAYWGTSDQMPLDHHEVVTLAAMDISVDRPSYDDFLDEGPQTVDSSGGQIVARQVGRTMWTTGMTSQSIAAQQHYPTERPSDAGDPIALMGIVFDATATGGDIDNRDGDLSQVGAPIVLDAPDGWVIDDAVGAWGARVTFEAELSDDGQTVSLAPVITDGTVFPQQWEGSQYVSTVAFILRLRPDNAPIPGIPTPSPEDAITAVTTGHKIALLRAAS